MRNQLLAITAIVAAMSTPIAAQAQGTVGVGGGAVVVDDGTGIAVERRSAFREYIVRERVPSYTIPDRVIVGGVLPEAGVTYYDVPQSYGVTSYRYSAAFDDGTADQRGTVAVRSIQLRMPYHVSGAAMGGFACIYPVTAAGQPSAWRRKLVRPGHLSSGGSSGSTATNVTSPRPRRARITSGRRAGSCPSWASMRPWISVSLGTRSSN